MRWMKLLALEVVQFHMWWLEQVEWIIEEEL